MTAFSVRNEYQYSCSTFDICERLTEIDRRIIDVIEALLVPIVTVLILLPGQIKSDAVDFVQCKPYELFEAITAHIA